MTRPQPRFKAHIIAVLVTALMCALAIAAAPAPNIDAAAIARQYDAVAAGKPLWPNFQPGQIPIAIFDGARTWLFRHPSPPPEFTPVPDMPGAFSSAGRYAAVTANTSADIGGMLTAVASGIKPAPVARQAALMVHEAFHVYQRQHHPDWSANEADLFLYPLDKAEALQLRRLESEALHRALDASGDECRCWARTALDMRAARFGQLPSAAVEYERRTELNEGLAQYVEDQAAGQTRADLMPSTEFAPDEIRLRAYSSGEAIALLLDRFNPPPEATQQNPRRFFGDWRDELDSGRGRFLDQILERRLAGTKPCDFYAPEKRAALQRAQNDVGQLQHQREQALRDFHALPGWRVVVESQEAGFQSQGFDPLNVTLVGNGLVLHRRYLKAGGNGATLEMVDGRALTEAAGAHPMFSGIRRLTIAGLTAVPSINEKGGGVSLTAPGLKAEFPKASVTQDDSAKQITISF
jgi:hypothetical protein